MVADFVLSGVTASVEVQRFTAVAFRARLESTLPDSSVVPSC
jgi:hypothetical protein